MECFVSIGHCLHWTLWRIFGMCWNVMFPFLPDLFQENSRDVSNDAKSKYRCLVELKRQMSTGDLISLMTESRHKSEDPVFETLRDTQWIAYVQNADHQSTIRPSVNLQGAQLERANWQGVDLREANLADANLYRADLRWADLYRADLRWADLRRAELEGAKLGRAKLGDSDLRGADLREADLRRAELRDADLRRAELDGVKLEGADLRGAKLTQQQLDEACGDEDTRLSDGLVMELYCE